MYFRGRHIRDEIIKRLMLSDGMGEASDVVVSGCSAGGLGMYLGIDQIANSIHAHRPGIIVTGLADSGFFLEHTPSGVLEPMTHMKFGRDEASVNGRLDYPNAMKAVFKFTNMKEGAHQECIRKYVGKEDNCVFAANLAPFIKTPMFHMQSRFDRWQLQHIAGKNYNVTTANIYGGILAETMKKTIITNHEAGNQGVFIDSCLHHCTVCWQGHDDLWSGNSIRANNMETEVNMANAFTEWYSGTRTRHFNKQKNGGVNVSNNNSPAYFYFQSGEYPCKNCCQCQSSF